MFPANEKAEPGARANARDQPAISHSALPLDRAAQLEENGCHARARGSPLTLGKMGTQYEARNPGLFAKFGTESQATKTIHLAAHVFIASAILQAAIVVFFLPIALIWPLALCASALVLKRKKSKAAAIVLLCMASLSVFGPLVQIVRTGQPTFGGVLIGAVLVYVAVRALQATSTLSRWRKNA